MPYHITQARALGQNHVEISYNTGDGRPDDVAVFAVANLRRRVHDGLAFEQIFPIWLAAQLETLARDAKTITRAELKTLVEGKTIRMAPTRDKADADDAALGVR